MLDPAITSVLSAKRDHLNERFLRGKHQYPKLEADAFHAFLRDTLVPLAEAALDVAPARLDVVTLAVFDIGLSLVGQGLAGPGNRAAAIEDGLRQLGKTCMPLLAEQPVKGLSALANALHHLAFSRGARPGQWIEDLKRVLPHVSRLEELLVAGQLAAWRAGLSHFRNGALDLAGQLPDAAGRALFEIPSGALWTETLGRLSEDRWYDPSVLEPTLQARWVGGFVGFGGLFSQPPTVARSGEHVLVKSGTATWLLIADTFGATLHKATADEIEEAGQFKIEDLFEIRGDRVFYGGKTTPLTTRGDLTSATEVCGTLAATFSHSHDVALFPSRFL